MSLLQELERALPGTDLFLNPYITFYIIPTETYPTLQYLDSRDQVKLYSKYFLLLWHFLIKKINFVTLYVTGMEDKIIATKGLCMLVTDKGVGFFDDIWKKQKNHESDL